jgi:tetratricopeptide (TPR) repeat protein
MALFDKIRGWIRPGGETGDLTSPEGFARAAGVLERGGRLAEAAVLLAEGVRQFPDAPALRTYHERVERRRLRERTAELAKTLQARPDPALSLELVRIYREIADTVSARRVASEAIEKFPNYAPLHQAMGELWLEIYEHSSMTQDGITALRCLERSVELDPANLSARELLVSLYGKIGAWRKALRHAVSLLERLRPGQVGRVALEALAQQKLPEEDVNTLLRSFSRSMEKAGPTITTPPEEERMAKALELFHDLRGRRVASILVAGGQWREAADNERMDKDALTKGVKGLKSAAIECCFRMSIGGFVMAQIETPDATAYLKIIPPAGGRETESGVWRSATFFLLTNDAARKREVLARLAHI